MIECCNLCGKRIENVVYTSGGKHRRTTFYDNLSLHLSVAAQVLTKSKTVPVVVCGECIIESLSGKRERS